MKIFTFLVLALLCVPGLTLKAQTAGSPTIWQVDSFELAVNVQQAERLINVTSTLTATNIGGSAGRTLTVRLYSKAKINSVSVNGAAATFRPGQDPRGDLLRAEISLPNAVNPASKTR